MELVLLGSFVARKIDTIRWRRVRSKILLRYYYAPIVYTCTYFVVRTLEGVIYGLPYETVQK